MTSFCRLVDAFIIKLNFEKNNPAGLCGISVACPVLVGAMLRLERYSVRGEVFPGAVFDRTFDRTIFNSVKNPRFVSGQNLRK